ncbi:MAG: PIN domain nuclease [Acidobacteria bacterium]|nr:PIN domain nuclease [Acidobacteriota bacterium]
MTIVDTTVWIDYLGGRSTPQTEWFDSQLTRQPFGLTDLILCEILQGVRDTAMATRVRRELAHFDVFDAGGEALAIAAADNYRSLRSRGHTVRKTIDCLIATFCLMEGHSLLHHDRDFDPFERYLGLRVVHP